MRKTPEFLAGLYERSGLSHREIGERCGLSKVAVWRAVTPGWAIKGHTLDVLLREGFGLAPDSREYKKAVSLWTQERLTGPDTVAAKQDLIKQVAGMDQEDSRVRVRVPVRVQVCDQLVLATGCVSS